jgi:hypothetical protein
MFGWAPWESNILGGGYNSREIEYRLLRSIHVGVCDRNKQPPLGNLALKGRFSRRQIPPEIGHLAASTPAPYYINDLMWNWHSTSNYQHKQINHAAASSRAPYYIGDLIWIDTLQLITSLKQPVTQRLNSYILVWPYEVQEGL